MASSLINNAIQVYFDSVLGVEHEGMVAMFEALLLSGLSGFLGCSSAIHEAALVEFFHNASVRDGKVVSTVQGKPVAISEELFAGTFELSLEGLTDFHEMKEHKLEWTWPYSSHLFEGSNVQPGVFIPRSNMRFKSTCWIRAMILVDRSWLIVEGVDYWRPISRPVDSQNWEMLPQRPYIDDLAPLCVFVEPVIDLDSRSPFSRLIRDQWTEVCVAVVQFSLLGFLHAVGTVNRYRDIIGPVVDIEEPEIQTLSSSSDVSTIYRSPSPRSDSFSQRHLDSVTADPIVQIETVQDPVPTASDSFSQRNLDTFLNSPSQSASTDSRMLFTTGDIPLGDETTDDQILMPTNYFSPNHLHSSGPLLLSFPLSSCGLKTAPEISRMNSYKRSIILRKLLQKLILSKTESFEEVQEQKAALSQDMDDKLKGIQDQQAALSHDLIEFLVQAQENFNILTSQLEHYDVLSIQMDSDLVIYRTTLVRTFQVSTGCVLGKWVCLVTLVMSLFDLQDVCIAIGSLATLDLPMVVDLIGIYVLKGPYCALTTTNWFLQALSVIPRGSWRDVARRFTMIRWASPKL
ncbi:thioredoxin-like 1-1, chloroplastic-like [Dorcoceras hygrometricum]|uniref:Thioredoxin-like 1-1, chloroplastic-like n=1 Tax=Dorcoceras hygrometricum TaxID=472368 RepID=A0A2Z7CMZ2_9LAMI|nr:thioredoxin-like 1-1, chloroplastic-like [Dorcoceras hygrometricum]